MPRVTHVKKARKDNPVAKKGESYYWWKFAFSPKSYSKEYPKASQLTQSDFKGQVYDLQDRLNELPSDDTLPDAVSEIAEEIRSLGSEQEDKKQNMPENLQYSETADLLEQRGESCNEWADELEGVDLSVDEDQIKDDAAGELDKTDYDNEDDYKQDLDNLIQAKTEEAWDEKGSELQNCEYNGE